MGPLGLPFCRTVKPVVVAAAAVSAAAAASLAPAAETAGSPESVQSPAGRLLAIAAVNSCWHGSCSSCMVTVCLVTTGRWTVNTHLPRRPVAVTDVCSKIPSYPVTGHPRGPIPSVDICNEIWTEGLKMAPCLLQWDLLLLSAGDTMARPWSEPWLYKVTALKQQEGQARHIQICRQTDVCCHSAEPTLTIWIWPSIRHNRPRWRPYPITLNSETELSLGKSSLEANTADIREICLKRIRQKWPVSGNVRLCDLFCTRQIDRVGDQHSQHSHILNAVHAAHTTQFAGVIYWVLSWGGCALIFSSHRSSMVPAQDIPSK